LWETDWSEVKAFLEDLKNSGVEDLTALFHSNRESALACWRRMKIVDVNKAGLNLFRLKNKRSIAQWTDNLDWQTAHSALIENLVAIAEGKAILDTEMELHTATGETIHVSVRWSVAPGFKETLSRVLVSVVDVTERRKALDLLVHGERLKAVGDLATGVAHNFNNLLQVILGGAQLAALGLDFGDVSDAKHNLNHIVESAKQGSELVKRLQSFARLRAQTPASDAKLLNLSDVVRQAIEMSKIWWKTVPEKRGLHVELAADLVQECLVVGRENELFEVTVNLIKNAAEALHRGGWIRVNTSVVNDEVFLRVSDNGAGIDQEHIGKVFEPFFTTKGFQSAGMGLSSSLGMVTAHKGILSVAGKPGEGTTLTAVFPLARPDAESTRLLEREPSAGRLKVLVIDDMQPVLRMLENGLKKYHQTVRTALSGHQGIKLFRESMPDVVVCDLGMPGMDGWEVGKHIRSICRETNIRKPAFILLTGWGGQMDERDKIAQCGVDAIVEKPVDILELERVMRELGLVREPKHEETLPLT
jgi:two-component system, cell cycle sensor histidine kinase and response regulator CckA